ncbi:hypothetical protein ACO0LF_25185 [Undibacterium sp. Di27W]|uniref:hypothetical protein n=1 Tax=Undibacterium sp. Di27W TaxID=3413036 RepID=UPI003BF019F5
MLKAIKVLLLTSFAVLHIGAMAQQCNPRDFTIEDINSYSLSDSVKYSAYSIFNENSSSSANRRADATIPIANIPVNISVSDAKAMANSIYSSSGVTLDRDYHLNIVNSALSAVGANMYSNCLAAETIKVTIPQEAYQTDEFFLTVKWAPSGNISSINSKIKIRVVKGLIESSDIFEGDINVNQSRIFKIKNQSKWNENQFLQIAIEVDNQAHPSIAIPPVAQLPKLNFVQRQGKSKFDVNLKGNVCTNQAYLVSAVGSSASNNAKSCTLCVQPSANGVLLQSTARITAGLSAKGAAATLSSGNSALEMCAKFEVSGAGIGSGRFEVGEGSNFTVYEAISKK